MQNSLVSDKTYAVCFCSSERKALNIFEETRIAYFRVKYFMLAIKIKVIKITKKASQAAI